MNQEIINKLERIRNIEKEYNDDLFPPVQINNINSFIEKFENFFNYEIDKNFIEFIKICNGLDFNGYTVFSSYDHSINKVEYGVFQNNELFYEQDEDDKNYILYGFSGMDLYVFNKEDKEYQLLDRVSGDKFESFKDFDDMLLYILKLMLNEDT